jgi:hypothetical protein
MKQEHKLAICEIYKAACDGEQIEMHMGGQNWKPVNPYSASVAANIIKSPQDYRVTESPAVPEETLIAIARKVSINGKVRLSALSREISKMEPAS